MLVRWLIKANIIASEIALTGRSSPAVQSNES